MKRQGFTLIELMIVIAVIGLLAAVAMPRFTKVSDSAKAAQVQGNLTSMRTALEMVHAKAGEYPKGMLNEQNSLHEIVANGVKFTDFYSKSERPFIPAFKDIKGNKVESTNIMKIGKKINGEIIDFTGNSGWLVVTDENDYNTEIYANLSTPVKKRQEKQGTKPFDPFGQGIDWTKF